MASKLHGLAGLMSNWNGEPITTNDDTHDGIHGLGMIFADLADQVKSVWVDIENECQEQTHDKT